MALVLAQAASLRWRYKSRRSGSENVSSWLAFSCIFPFIQRGVFPAADHCKSHCCTICDGSNPTTTFVLKDCRDRLVERQQPAIWFLKSVIQSCSAAFAADAKNKFPNKTALIIVASSMSGQRLEPPAAIVHIYLRADRIHCHPHTVTKRGAQR